MERSLASRRASYEEEVRRLIAASFDLIRESGALEPRVSAIVRRARLSNQAFYRHFRSKDELLLAVLDEGVAILESYLRHRMAGATTATGRVRAWMEGMLEQVLDAEAAAATRPFALSRARLAELFPSEVEASEQRLRALLRDALQEAGAELPRAVPDRDAETLYGPGHGMDATSAGAAGTRHARGRRGAHGLRPARGAPEQPPGGGTGIAWSGSCCSQGSGVRACSSAHRCSRGRR